MRLQGNRNETYGRYTSIIKVGISVVFQSPIIHSLPLLAVSCLYTITISSCFHLDIGSRLAVWNHRLQNSMNSTCLRMTDLNFADCKVRWKLSSDFENFLWPVFLSFNPRGPKFINPNCLHWQTIVCRQASTLEQFFFLRECDFNAKLSDQYYM